MANVDYIRRRHAAHQARKRESANRRRLVLRSLANTRGILSRTAKLDDAKVRKIRALAASGKSRRELSEAFGVALSTIADVLTRNTWSHVQ